MITEGGFLLGIELFNYFALFSRVDNFVSVIIEKDLLRLIFLSKNPLKAEGECYSVSAAVSNHSLEESGEGVIPGFLYTEAVFYIRFNTHIREYNVVSSELSIIQDIPDHPCEGVRLPAVIEVSSEFNRRVKLNSV